MVKENFGKSDFEKDIESRLGPQTDCIGAIGRRASMVPDVPLRQRALMAHEIENSDAMGGGKCYLWSYESGIMNALARCCAIFGAGPYDILFEKTEDDWYHVKIEDIILMTRDYCEHFGMFWWLMAPCPYCGELIRGNDYFYSLSGLGRAIKMHEPQEKHFEQCYPWRKVCAEKMGSFLLVQAVEYTDWLEVYAATKT